MKKLPIDLIDDLAVGLNVIETLAFATNMVAQMCGRETDLRSHVGCLANLIEEKAKSLNDKLLPSNEECRYG